MNAPIEHSFAFRQRRFINWFPMGLTYALLYMGRYNLTVSKNALGDLMTKEDFGIIFAAGTFTYAFAFLINGPLVDKIGGRRGILLASLGAGLMNLGMGLYLWWTMTSGSADNEQIRMIFALLYSANMYFQSYGAVAIVKVNAHWFHVRERGGFSGIFGTMISSGIFLAFTVNGWILNFAARGTTTAAAAMWVFFAPATLLLVFFIIEAIILRDTPALAGFKDFDTGDASSGEEFVEIPVLRIMKRVVTNPIILTVALIEFCTGVLRNGVMHWFPIYAKEIWVLPSSHYLRFGSWGNAALVTVFFGVAAFMFYAGSRCQGRQKAWLVISGGLIFLTPFLQGGWGGILFVAGVIGANVAGWVSDLFFGSRRAPVAGILYGILAVASIGMFFTLGGTYNKVGWTASPEGPLMRHDRILKIEKQEVNTWDEVDRALDALPVTGAEIEVSVTIKRTGTEQVVVVPVPIDKVKPAAFGVLPENGFREASGKAEPVILSLEEGDKVLGVAVSLEELREIEPYSTWEDVSYAVSAVPAEGLGKARWNPEKRMCTYDGTGIPKGERASTGLLFMTVNRAEGSVVELAFRDPAPKMHAGDERVLKAGPVLILDPMWLGLVVFFMSIAVIGTHGLLSGTATMDFGGRKGAATAVGMIDGFVYLGTGFQSLALGYLTTLNWSYWPAFLFPFGIIGFLLLKRIWFAIPTGRKK
jgi:OPA family glycerol-3-phosphate transporter-like MFS transporter